jgi:hypothetical protein
MEINQQKFGICNLSLVSLRAEPSDRSEMISQLLFGDVFQILEGNEKWVHIKLDYDGYEGWIDRKQFVSISKEQYLETGQTVEVLPLKIFNEVKKNTSGESLFLVAGSSIPYLRNNVFKVNEESYQLSESLERTNDVQFSDIIVPAAKFYLNAPYLWGGRSIFGIDCSGFTQMVFKQFGVKLKRDAWQQAEQGDLVSFLPEALAGDLAFFDNEEGRIVHVGIMLDNSNIIHASGKVRIDAIDDQGIYNSELKRYTHKLRIIKRFNS